MELFAGKTASERNKIIAAAVLGALALAALFMAFGPSLRSGKASVMTPPIPSPTVKGTTSQDPGKFDVPPQQAQNNTYASTAVPSVFESGPGSDSGRNIFAFYEPPPTTPYQPTQVPIKTPAPTPTPPVLIAYVMPQTIYAGSGGFRLEVNGDKLAPETKILFSQSQVPTVFVNAQKLTAEIPASLIANEGPKTIMVQSADGKLYSNQVMLNVQAPPKPQFTYIGLIARKRYNNDTAYFMESGKQTPVAARLNDVVAGRYRLMSISADEAVLEDINLGFRYKLALVKTGPPSIGSSGFPNTEVYNPYYPPGMPGVNPNVRYMPPPQPQQQAPTRQRPVPQKDPDKDKDKDKDTSDDDTDN